LISSDHKSSSFGPECDRKITINDWFVNYLKPFRLLSLAIHTTSNELKKKRLWISDRCIFTRKRRQ
jgi:hypothetical protein